MSSKVENKENTPIKKEIELDPIHLVHTDNDEADDGKKMEFQKNYRKAGCCSKVFFMYGNRLVNAIQKNDGKGMTEEMIESMTITDDETEQYVSRFLKELERRS